MWNHIFFRAVFMELTVIARISSASDIKSFKRSSGNNSAAIMSSIQYRLSSHSSSTIPILAMNSVVDLALHAAL